MFYKFVWNTHPRYLRTVSVVAHPFQYGRSESSLSHSVFDGDDAVKFLCDFFEQCFIERLEESHIVVGNAQCRSRFYFSNHLFHIVSDRSQGKYRHVIAVFQLASGAGLDFLHLVLPIYQHALASRIANHIAALSRELG